MAAFLSLLEARRVSLPELECTWLELGEGSEFISISLIEHPLRAWALDGSRQIP